MILIADSGSTKTTWCLVEKDNHKTEFITEGYNPNYVTADYLLHSLRTSLPEKKNWGQVKNVYFYGAGCSEDRYTFMRSVLKQVFTNADIEIAMDLLASARALLGHKAGFAAILGTGTNSCLYDGTHITHNIDSLGFILGDEGSGGYIGKRLLKDYIRGEMPEEVRSLFWNAYHLTGDEIIEHVYTKPMSNRYCAGFCRFLSNNQHPYLQYIIKDSFRSFFRNIVCRYPNYSCYTLNCIGSVAFHFKNELTAVSKEFGMPLGCIIADPMPRLVNYHLASV